MHVSSFVGPRLRALALAMGGALLGVGFVLPEAAPYATPVGVAAFFLGGLGLQVPEWAAVRPLLPAALAPAAVAIAQALQHPEGLPIPEGLKPWAPLAAGLLALLAGKVLPVHGTYSPKKATSEAAQGDEVLLKAYDAVTKAGPLPALLLAVALASAGCAAGPARQSIQESLSSPEAPAPSTPGFTASSEEAPKASPFSAGFALAVGVPFKGGAVVPAQLLVGGLKVSSVGPRAVSLLAVGGLSGTSISHAQAAWGAGMGFELTPGTFLYQVDASAGVFWTSEREGPLGFLGFTVAPKM